MATIVADTELVRTHLARFPALERERPKYFQAVIQGIRNELTELETHPVIPKRPRARSISGQAGTWTIRVGHDRATAWLDITAPKQMRLTVALELHDLLAKHHLVESDALRIKLR